jgi:hypothetical protein
MVAALRFCTYAAEEFAARPVPEMIAKCESAA